MLVPGIIVAPLRQASAGLTAARIVPGQGCSAQRYYITHMDQLNQHGSNLRVARDGGTFGHRPVDLEASCGCVDELRICSIHQNRATYLKIVYSRLDTNSSIDQSNH